MHDEAPRAVKRIGPDDLAAMQTVLAVVDAGSMTEGARQLGRSTSSVSREITALERRLGVPLLVRTSRGVVPTEIGGRYVTRARDVWERTEALHAELREQAGEPVGQVRVTAARAYGALRVVPILAELVQRYPKLSIDVDLGDRTVDLARERVDVAVRHLHGAPGPDVVARRIGDDDPVLCAAPRYVAARGAPTRASELLDHELVLPYAFVGRDLVLREGDQTRAVHPRSRLTLSSIFGVIEAVRAGAGIARISRELVADDLAAGRLVEVLPGAVLERLHIYVVTLPGPRWPRAVRTVVDALMAGLVSPPRSAR